MSTYYEPIEPSRWFRDLDGIPTTSKHQDEAERYTIDWSDELASGETVSTSAWTTSGVTSSATGSTSTTTYATITGANGSAKNTVVTTGGTVARTLVRTLRFVGVPEGNPASDYR